jgi:hypothetical protein
VPLSSAWFVVNFITMHVRDENLQSFGLQQAILAFNRLFGNFGEICSSQLSK